ncbi:unnamed protein product [Miscanthus lutarioriparius]|uniref:Uncharacterized protein n=1 Tax=Miscanthus lutarioriparius TaxID=422564 RepID=A0A811QUG3_9POAL|nr:unnamed protein product [Miscanthus lutarioriparius]
MPAPLLSPSVSVLLSLHMALLLILCSSLVGDSCSSVSDCGTGLYCGNCPAAGRTKLSCIRDLAIQPTSIVVHCIPLLYSWLVTHNSFSILGEPSCTGVERVTFYNQEDSVTNHLRVGSGSMTKLFLGPLCLFQNGVRGLMLDMYDFNDDVWLCHSLLGQCYNFTAFVPAVEKEVEAFLSENPTEIITIFIEDYVQSPMGLSKVFTAADLMKYWYPISEMPTGGKDWPSVTDMFAKNRRLLVFTSDALKEASEGIAYQWSYLVENESGDPGIVPGSCPNRKESQPLNSSEAMVVVFLMFKTESMAAPYVVVTPLLLARWWNAAFAAPGWWCRALERVRGIRQAPQQDAAQVPRDSTPSSSSVAHPCWSPVCSCYLLVDVFPLQAFSTRGPESFNILRGHSRATTFLIYNNAAQDILSSFFFKYADTILKKYSSTVATIFTILASAAFLGHTLTINFLLGISVVFISMHQFFSPLAKVKDDKPADLIELEDTQNHRSSESSFVNMTAGAADDASHRIGTDERQPLLPT